jgi:hypothetical protein
MYFYLSLFGLFNLYYFTFNIYLGNGFWIDNDGNEIRTDSNGCETNIADIFSKKYINDECFNVNFPYSEITTNMEDYTTEELNFDLKLETAQLADYVQALKFEETDEYFEVIDQVADLTFEFELIDNDSD